MSRLINRLAVIVCGIVVVGAADMAAAQPVTGPSMVGRASNAASVIELRKSIKTTIDRLQLPQDASNRLTEAVRYDLRIVGGEPASIEENLWQVALVRGLVREPNRKQFCGGSIIAPNWVITAAHCVDNFIVSRMPARVNVVAGATNYKQGGQRVAVTRIIVHPDWAGGTMDNDLALLELAQNLTVGEQIPIVAEGSELALPDKLTVTGWGALFESGPGSDQLMGVQVSYVTSDVCNQADSYAGAVTSNMFCAGDREGGLDACQGDSGGPIWIAKDGVATLAGVVSWGDGCARELKYGIYTKLANYVDWIGDETGTGDTN